MNNAFRVTVLFALCCNAAFAATPPKPATSKWLKSLGGGFAVRLTEDKKAVESCKYSLMLAPNQELKQPLYLKVLFENPKDPKQPLTANSVLQPDMKKVVVNSGEVRGLKAGKNYKITVEVYDSEKRSKKIGEHVQLLMSLWDVN